LDPKDPFNYYDSRGAHIYHPGPIETQPFVEVSVPLSVTWGTTAYHGGQAQFSNVQGPPYQGQPSYGQQSYRPPYYGQPYPGKTVGPQGQPIPEQPSAFSGSSFTYFGQPT